jgi:TamB, inner membrane protein subunit of TAM complex
MLRFRGGSGTSMAEPDTPPAKPTRSWLKWLGLVALGVTVLLVIFHRPIVFKTTRYFIARAAEKQKLELEYELQGSIFTGLRVEQLRGTPSEPGPVEVIKIDLLNLRYSLWGLITDGLPGFLKSVDIVDAYVELNPREKLPPHKRRKRQEIKFPALFPDRLRIENVTLISHTKRGDFVIEELDFVLEPQQPGRLSIGRLQIPRVRTWHKIKAATATYEERNLLLKNLTLDPELSITLLNIDASELDEDVLRFSLHAELFQGDAQFDGVITDLNESNRTKVDARLSSISLDQMSEYLNVKPAVTGSVRLFTLNFSGALSNPSTWSGDGFGQFTDLSRGEREFGSATVRLGLADGKARLTLQELRQDSNRVTATAEIKLPDQLDELPYADADGQFSIDAPDLSKLGIAPEQNLQGTITAEGTFRVRDRELVADFSLQTANLKSRSVETTKGSFSGHLTRKLKPEKQEKPQQRVELKGETEGLRFRDYVADRGQVNFTAEDRKIIINQLDVRKDQNVVSLKGEYTLPEKDAEIDLSTADVTIDISAPGLKDFVAVETGKQLEGALKVEGRVFRHNGKLQGSISIEGNDLSYSGIAAEQLTTSVEIIDNVAHIKALALRIDETNQFKATGSIQLQKPYEYSGSVDGNLQNLAVFEPLLKDGKKIGGSLDLRWIGQGTITPAKHSGEGELIVSKGSYGDLQPITAHVSGNYFPDKMTFPTVQLSVRDTAFSAVVYYAQRRMEITEIELKQNADTVLYGNAKFPLELRQQGPSRVVIPDAGEFDVVIQSRDVEVTTLSTMTGAAESPVSGTVTLSLTAHGPRANLLASMDLSARDLQLTKKPELQPTNIDVKLLAKDRQLTLEGVLRQPQVQPMQVQGRVPVNFAAENPRDIIPPAAPLDLTLTLPQSSLAFLPTFVDAVRDVEGSAALSVNVSGTRNNPQMSGSAVVDVQRMRFKNANIPPVGLLDGRISFTRDHIVFDRFSGEIAGGPFNLAGRIDLPKLTEPVFSLKFASDSALLVRNDTITVRADTDVGITGPLKSGTVSGSVTVTDSRFFREVEILPLSLPGRPAPRPPGAGGPRHVSFDNPILRDWKFDIAIKTVPAEPFLIRGNLAEGQAHIDLHLSGNGLEPVLAGSVRIENFVTSLPFSRMTVDGGIVYFTEAQPFVPQLQIQGKTQMRDYDITAYIYGTPQEPQVVFTSEPPLPQDEIIALLATGATKRELLEGGQVVAGRATLLAFQSLYRKIFKKRSAPRDESFLDRFDFQLGAVDPKTGRESVQGELKLTDQWSMVGSFDIQGDFRGSVKYLIRFR